MHFTSWVTFVRKLWINPCNICIFVCRGPSVDTWPCTSQFLKLGPEILTRDLNQAKTEVKVRCKKKKKRCNFPCLKLQQKFWAGRRRTFFFFLACELEYVAQLVSNHVSTFQIQTSKIGCGIAILSRSGSLARPSS